MEKYGLQVHGPRERERVTSVRHRERNPTDQGIDTSLVLSKLCRWPLWSIRTVDSVHFVARYIIYIHICGNYCIYKLRLFAVRMDYFSGDFCCSRRLDQSLDLGTELGVDRAKVLWILSIPNLMPWGQKPHHWLYQHFAFPGHTGSPGRCFLHTAFFLKTIFYIALCCFHFCKFCDHLQDYTAPHPLSTNVKDFRPVE